MRDRALKGRGFCALACILFPIIHLLLKFLGFLLICEGKACQAVLELKRVEEGPVLVVIERIVYLLIP